MTGHDRAYRTLLRLYPATFRDEYGQEMARLFGEQLRDARAARGPMAVAGLWARAIADVLETAPGHHLRREGHVPEPIAAGTPSAGVPIEAHSRRAPRIVLGLLPLWVLIFFALAAPGFMDPMFANPPAIAGLPAGVFVLVVAMVLTLAGVLFLRRTRSDLATVLVLLVFTVPAMALILFGPAAILLLQSWPLL